MPHRRQLTAFAIAVILVAGILVRGYRSDGSELTNAELEAVRGSEEELGCLQYHEDLLQPSLQCVSPFQFFGVDNDCDWLMCSSMDVAQSCGRGRGYKNLNAGTWFAINMFDPDVAWANKAKLCWIEFECTEGQFNAAKHCKSGVYIPGPAGDTIIGGQGCVDPALSQVPSGCKTCSRGTFDPLRDAQDFWTTYEQVECNIP